MTVGDCDVRDLVFVAGEDILRFKSNLIDGVATCSNMSWTILSPLDIWNRFWLLLTSSMFTLPLYSGSRIPAATSTLCVVDILVRGTI